MLLIGCRVSMAVELATEWRMRLWGSRRASARNLRSSRSGSGMDLTSLIHSRTDLTAGPVNGGSDRSPADLDAWLAAHG
jgi:hypothetical protein